jgi:hypothetical protein
MAEIVVHGAAEPEPPPQELAKRVEELRGIVVSSYGELAQLVEKRQSTYLFILGTSVIAIGIVMKFIEGAEEQTYLSPGEFISMLALGLLLQILGAVLLLLQFNNISHTQERIVAAAVIEGTLDQPHPPNGDRP